MERSPAIGGAARPDADEPRAGPWGRTSKDDYSGLIRLGDKTILGPSKGGMPGTVLAYLQNGPHLRDVSQALTAGIAGSTQTCLRPQITPSSQPQIRLETRPAICLTLTDQNNAETRGERGAADGLTRLVHARLARLRRRLARRARRHVGGPVAARSQPGPLPHGADRRRLRRLARHAGGRSPQDRTGRGRHRRPAARLWHVRDLPAVRPARRLAVERSGDRPSCTAARSSRTAGRHSDGGGEAN